MKALVYDGRRCTLKNIPAPTPHEDEVLLRIIYAGICGTDRAILSGKLPVSTPLIPGHEFVGELIEAPGAGSEYLGQTVVGEMNITCGTCSMCRMGEPTHCLHNRQLGIDIHGAFAEYLVLPAANVHPVPTSLSPKKAVLTEPLAACLRSQELAPVSSEETAAVIGPGIIGSLSLQVLRAQHPARIAVIGRSDESLRSAAQLGAEPVIDIRRENPVETLQALTGGAGADYVVEATGSPEGIKEAAALTRPRGRLVLKSTTGLRTDFPSDDIIIRELQLIGTRCGPFDTALNHLEQKIVPGLPVEIYPPEKLEEALAHSRGAPVKRLLAF